MHHRHDLRRNVCKLFFFVQVPVEIFRSTKDFPAGLFPKSWHPTSLAFLGSLHWVYTPCICMLLCASHASHVHPPGCTCFIPESLKSLCRPQTSWLLWLPWLLWLGGSQSTWPHHASLSFGARRWESRREWSWHCSHLWTLTSACRGLGVHGSMMVHGFWMVSVHATSHTTMISVMLRFCLILVAVWVVWHSFNPGFLWISVSSWSSETVRSPYR